MINIFLKELVLQRVLVGQLPSLVENLAKNFDKALIAVSNTLPPLPHGLITAEQREVDRNTLMRNEKEVATFYDITTVKYCLSVASMFVPHTASFSQRNSLLFSVANSQIVKLRTGSSASEMIGTKIAKPSWSACRAKLVPSLRR